MRGDERDILQARAGPGDEHEVDRHEVLAHDPDAGHRGQGVLRGRDAAVDRVLDRDHRRVRTALDHVGQRFADVVDRAPLLPAGLGHLRERRLGEGSGGSEEAVGAARGFLGLESHAFQPSRHRACALRVQKVATCGATRQTGHMSRAGQPAEASDLIDVDDLIAAYYDRKPDTSVPEQRVAFGTSGHRGSSLSTSFNEDHILATTQAIVDYRNAQGIAGPLFLGRDTHGLSLPAERTAIEVLIANGVDVRVDSRDSWVPTPALSHAILAYNRGRALDDPGRADGIVVTPSHNPPRDGGFKYNPPNGGPADTDATGWVADRANALIAAGLEGVQRTRYADLDADTLGEYDFRDAYVRDLANIIDVEAIRKAGVRIGADPLGGASVEYWALIAEVHGLDLTVVNPDVDPTWRFMTLDWDEKIRMDPSSPSAMASLVARREEYDILTGQRRRRRSARHRDARRRAS